MSARQVLDRAMSEADLQASIIDLARTLGWTVLHIDDARREVVTQAGERRLVGDKNAAGLPDLIMLRERIVWAELKRERGRLRPTQQRILADLRRAGAEVYLWKPSDWPAIQHTLTSRRPG